MTSATLSSSAALKAQAREELAAIGRVAVLGAGVSGRAAARLLLHLQKDVLLLDDADLSGHPEVRALLDRGARCVWRPASFSGLLDGAGLLIPSPGVRPDHPLRLHARALGLAELSEIELAWAFSGASRAAAITGTNGKTTVTLLVEHLLRSSGIDSIAAGNIGLAFSDALLAARDRLDSFVFALEVSSFQLQTVRRFAPEFAVLLNITPDHLDRHQSFADYAQSKARVAVNQSERDVLVVNRDDPACLDAARQSRARLLHFSLQRPVSRGAWLEEDRLMIALDGPPGRLASIDAPPLLGMHNLANCLAASCVAAALGLGRKAIGRALETFQGARHRIQKVATLDGVDFYDDSKATNVDSVAKALASFFVPVHLIAGGRDKDSPFAALLPLLRERVAGAYLIGEAASKIHDAWSSAVPVSLCQTLDRALEAAAAAAQPGEVVLLSPGCASFDQFRDYAHRGDEFARWVLRRAGTISPGQVHPPDDPSREPR